VTESEKSIQNRILVELSAAPDVLVWRQNVGMGTMTNADGSTHKMQFGVPGMADIGGICCGIALQLEVKSEKGKQTKQQAKWQKAVATVGGIYSVVRSPKDAWEAIEEARWRGAANSQTAK